METKLTKDADKLAGVIYREYLARLEGGTDKRNAKHFKSGFQNVLLPGEKPEDFKETLNELCRVFPMIKRQLHYAIVLGDDFIIYMENQYPKGLKQVVELLSTAFGVVASVVSIFK